MADLYANCTVSHKMHSDRRFDLLAELGGWTRNDACFRMVQLWARCTALKTDRPPAEEIRIHLGLRGEQFLLDAVLGERHPDGSIRVVGGGLTGGDTDRFGWYEPIEQRNVSGGLARADQARRTGRGPGGRFAPAGTTDHQRDDQQPSSVTSGSPASASASPASGFRIPEEEDLSPSACAIPQSVPEPVPLRASPPPTPAPASPLETSLETLWAEFEIERQRVAQVLRIELLPLAAHDRGRDDMARALAAARQAGERDLEVKRIRRAIAVAGAEAEGSQDPQWLTGAVFTQDNLRRLSGTTPAKAKQAAAERRAAQHARARGGKPEIPSMPTPPKFAPEAPLKDPVRDAGEFQELFAQLTGERSPAGRPTHEVHELYGDGQRAAPASADPITDERKPKSRKAAT